MSHATTTAKSVTYRVQTGHAPASPAFADLVRWAKRPDLGTHATLAGARRAYREMIAHRMRGVGLTDRIVGSDGSVYDPS